MNKSKTHRNNFEIDNKDRLKRDEFAEALDCEDSSRYSLFTSLNIKLPV